MSSSRFLTAITSLLLLTTGALAQSSNVSTVEITPSAKEVEVGQSVKLSVTAVDKAGKPINEKPSAFFAGPFDIAAVDDDGNVRLFGPGEVTVGAIVGGKAGLTTFMVKAPSIKTIEIRSLKTPLVVGGTAQLDAVTRIFNGDPRTGVPVSWTSDNVKVATVDAG